MSWGIVAGAAVGLVGAGMSADAAGDAADAQGDAAARTDATNRYIFDKQTELQKPFRDSGVTANNRLMHLLGIGRDPSISSNGMSFDNVYAMADADHRQKYGIGIAELDPSISKPWIDAMRAGAVETEGQDTIGDQWGSLLKNFGMADFEKDPGYQFRMDEGMKGVQGGAAARGNLLSGAAQKALQKYGQDYASNEFSNAYQRDTANKTNTYNRLAGIVNSGQGASNQISNAAGQYAQNTASNNAALGNAQAAGAIGQSNAWSNGLGQAYNGYQQNQLMNMIRNPSSGNSGYTPTTNFNVPPANYSLS